MVTSMPSRLSCARKREQGQSRLKNECNSERRAPLPKVKALIFLLHLLVDRLNVDRRIQLKLVFEVYPRSRGRSVPTQDDGLNVVVGREDGDVGRVGQLGQVQVGVVRGVLGDGAGKGDDVADVDEVDGLGAVNLRKEKEKRKKTKKTFQKRQLLGRRLGERDGQT